MESSVVKYEIIEARKTNLDDFRISIHVEGKEIAHAAGDLIDDHLDTRYISLNSLLVNKPFRDNESRFGHLLVEKVKEIAITGGYRAITGNFGYFEKYDNLLEARIKQTTFYKRNGFTIEIQVAR